MCKVRTLVSVVVIMCLLCGIASAEGMTDLLTESRTTQSFTEEPVSAENLQTILEAGLSAESAINQQPWYFVAITNQEVMNEIAGSAGGFGGGPANGMPEGGFPAGEMPDGEMPAGEMPDGEAPAGDIPDGERPMVPSQGGGMPGGSAKAGMGDSPVAIIIYMDESTSSPNPSFDCGLACENMVIAARSLGYGAKIISSPTMQLNGENHDALCEKLGVDTSYSAVAVLLIGREGEAVDGVSGASVRSGLEEKVSIID